MSKPQADRAMSLERSLAFRRALGNFLTGVTVVTTVDHLGRPRGITANSFTSVSLDPPLVLVCIAKNAESYEAFVSGGGFAVNILTDSQRSLSQLFASKSVGKFDAVKWRPGDNGAPVIDDSLAWFDCRNYQKSDAGDHMVLIGEVTRFGAGSGQPLGYCQGNYVNFGVINNAVEQAANARLNFGCIIHQADKLLLCRSDPDAPWSPPVNSIRKNLSGDQRALMALLHEAGINAELSFLYSVFEIPETGEICIFYRGELSAPPALKTGTSPEFRLFEFDHVPWGELASQQLQNMLRRYIREQASDSFGIYADAVGSGRVARLSGAPEPWRQP